MKIYFWNYPKILGFIFLNLCLGTWECEWILKKIFFEASAFMQKIDFLKFYVINTSDNLPFQPYFCNPHVISFQKMYILSVVQFMPKKMSATGLWFRLSLTDMDFSFPPITLLLGRVLSGFYLSLLPIKRWNLTHPFREVKKKEH